MVDVKDIRGLYKQFDKSELLDIAEELEISSDGSAKIITQRILDDIEESGVPEPDECSDLVLEFLVAADIIDEDGNIIEVEEEETTEDTLPDNLPECFTFADRRDPACQRCRVLDICEKERIKNRPECYGIRYSPFEEECKICIEAPSCLLLVQGDNQNG